MDVKYHPGWRPNQRVPCINIVDYSTSLQIMVPIFTRENIELVKEILRDSWIIHSMGGTPKILEMDSSSTNLSEELGDFCEAQGIDLQHIATGAHRQLGKVERHAHWFSQIFERVANECRPSSSEEFVSVLYRGRLQRMLSSVKVEPAPINLFLERICLR